MFTKRRAAIAVSGSAVIAVTGAAVALAAGSAFTPKLGSPNRQHVSPGRIRLTAKIADAKTVYVWVSRKHELEHGNLAQCTNAAKGCLVVTMKPWKHHKNGWAFTAPADSFRGYWATTPGKYYWQIQSFANMPPCKFGGANGDCALYSRIGTFTVR